MTWNYNFDEAPKGETREYTLPKSNGSGNMLRKITVKLPILISVGDEVLLTFWSEKRGQWSGLAEGQKPTAWQRLPEPAQ